jgi:hypothetical protein
MLGLIALMLVNQTTPGEVVQGKDLKVIPGPVAPTYGDPAWGMGMDHFMMRMRTQDRRGMVPTVVVPPGVGAIQDVIQTPAGWKAYQVEVPGRSTLQVRLRSDHEAWFYVTAVDRWGQMGAGMLQNRILTGNPEASFRNTHPEPARVYFIVDTTQTDFQSDAYTLELTFK